MYKIILVSFGVLACYLAATTALKCIRCSTETGEVGYDTRCSNSSTIPSTFEATCTTGPGPFHHFACVSMITKTENKTTVRRSCAVSPLANGTYTVEIPNGSAEYCNGKDKCNSRNENQGNSSTKFSISLIPLIASIFVKFM